MVAHTKRFIRARIQIENSKISKLVTLYLQIKLNRVKSGGKQKETDFFLSFQGQQAEGKEIC